jgi:glutaredoxin-related protein
MTTTPTSGGNLLGSEACPQAISAGAARQMTKLFRRENFMEDTLDLGGFLMVRDKTPGALRTLRNRDNLGIKTQI